MSKLTFTPMPDGEAASMGLPLFDAPTLTDEHGYPLDAFCEHLLETHGPCSSCSADYLEYLDEQAARWAEEPDPTPDFDSRWMDGPDVERTPGWWLDGRPQWSYIA